MFRDKKLAYILLIIVAVGIYFNTLQHQHTLDDSIVITENQFVKQGLKGIPSILTTDQFTGFFGFDKKLVEGGRYRPLTLVVFAIEYQFFGESPFVGHATNLIAYLLLVLLLYRLTLKILLQLNIPNESLIALVTALLFAVHPVHTEVVANCKGLDEITAMLLGVGYLYFMLKLYAENYHLKYVLLAGICLFLGLLAKENVIVYVIITIPLIFFQYKTHARRNSLITLGVMAIVILFYVLLRANAVGLFPGVAANDLLNNPFATASSSQKLPTIFLVLLHYLKLLVLPWPLTHDYYPFQIALAAWGNPLVILSLIVHVALLIVMFIYRSKMPVISFAIGFYLLHIVLVSNLVFSVGTFMNERFLFAPSYSFILLVAIGGIYIVKNQDINIKYLAGALFFGLLILQSVLVIKRNKVWKDNFTLFTTDVEVSTNSAKSNCSAGSEWVQYARDLKDDQERSRILNKAEKYLVKSLEIYPTYSDALIGLGNAYYYKNPEDIKAVQQYARLLSFAPQHEIALRNVKTIGIKSKNADVKRKALRLYLSREPTNYEVNYNLGRFYGMELNRPDSSVYFLERAYRVDSTKSALVKDLAIANAMSGNVKRAESLFLKNLTLAPNDPSGYTNMAYFLMQQGRNQDAAYYFTKAEELKLNRP